MSIAFVLLNVDLGMEGGVIAGLRDIEGVKEAWQIYGAYDIIAEIEAEDMEKVKGILQEGIRRLDGIRSTLTLMAI